MDDFDLGLIFEHLIAALAAAVGLVVLVVTCAGAGFQLKI